MKTAEDLIERLQLKPHSEGGYFRETDRSPRMVPVPYSSKPRPLSTAIYFLLCRSAPISRLHRIASNEMWHHYDGLPITIVELDSSLKTLSKIRLGKDFEAGQVPQYVVPAGHWFGARIEEEDLLRVTDTDTVLDYSLVGCTVSPGFDFQDFEIANGTLLASEFPEHAKTILSMI